MTNGFGKQLYSSGDIYEGGWKDDQRSGNGTHITADGEKYVGEFKNGLSHGFGNMTYPNGNSYEGEWKHDEYSGNGTYIREDGKKYVGEFKSGKKSGKGYLISSDGNKYVGHFQDNKKHGVGIMYYSNGRINRENWDIGILTNSDPIDETQIALFKEKDQLNLPNNIAVKPDVILEILDNSFENYIDEQMKIIEQNSKTKQSKHFTLEIAKYFRARIPNNYFDTMQIITATSELIFDKPDIIEWCQIEVGQWISLIGLEKYSQNFIEAGVDGIQLIKCNVFDLKKTF